MEGDALVKQLTGAQVMAMDRDVPALEKMQPEESLIRLIASCTTVTSDAGDTTLTAIRLRVTPKVAPHGQQNTGGRENL
jgi:hypothetical protein